MSIPGIWGRPGMCDVGVLACVGVAGPESSSREGSIMGTPFLMRRDLRSEEDESFPEFGGCTEELEMVRLALDGEGVSGT